MPIRLKPPSVGAPYAAVPALQLPSEAQVLRRREAFINELSAFVSLAGLVVLLLNTNAMLFEFVSWQHFIPTARNPSTVQHMQDFRAELEGQCDIPHLAIASFEVRIKTDGVEHTHSAMPLAFETTAFNPSLLLIWVLAWSAGFQSYRSTMLYRALDLRATSRPPGRLERLSLSVWLAVAAHVLLWVRVFSLKTLAMHNGSKIVFLFVTSVVAFWPVLSGAQYRADRPDYGRWLEYSLTAPLQIVIVACAVWIRDRATLYALFSAQATLMVCGALIEECVQRIYRCNEKTSHYTEVIESHPETSMFDSGSDSEDESSNRLLTAHIASKQRRRSTAVYTTLSVLSLAWSSFVVIWYIVITQFQRQSKHAGACDACARHTAATCPTTGSADVCELAAGTCQGRNDIPAAVRWIVATQCLLFGLFGLVQSLQIYRMRGVSTREQARSAWLGVSYYYAILSVTAKSVLEIGFLVMLSQMPGSVRTA